MLKKNDVDISFDNCRADFYHICEEIGVEPRLVLVGASTELIKQTRTKIVCELFDLGYSMRHLQKALKRSASTIECWKYRRPKDEPPRTSARSARRSKK